MSILNFYSWYSFKINCHHDNKKVKFSLFVDFKRFPRFSFCLNLIFYLHKVKYLRFYDGKININEKLFVIF